MSKSIPSFTPSKLKISSGMARIGEFERVRIIGMRFSIANTGRTYPGVTTPDSITMDHVAVLSILFLRKARNGQYVETGHDKRVALVCETLTVDDRETLLNCWSQWENHLALNASSGIDVWMAASSSALRTWTLDSGYWSTIYFGKELPEIAKPKVEPSGYGVGRQL
jgi:hypothetical protein